MGESGKVPNYTLNFDISVISSTCKTWFMPQRSKPAICTSLTPIQMLTLVPFWHAKKPNLFFTGITRNTVSLGHLPHYSPLPSTYWQTFLRKELSLKSLETVVAVTAIFSNEIWHGNSEYTSNCEAIPEDLVTLICPLRSSCKHWRNGSLVKAPERQNSWPQALLHNTKNKTK